MSRIFRLSLLLCSLLGAGVARAENVVETPPNEPGIATAEDQQKPPSALAMELAEKGFQLGAPAFIRIFKADSSLEMWMLRGGRFELYRRYTICKWSGVLGPKLHEGDRQSPEGVYYVTGGDLIVNRRWHRAMNVGFPNARDEALGLTGSGILIHGKCTSIGCFALTDGVVEDVFEIVQAALDAGQPRIPVHIFPFALTREKLASTEHAEWSDFWKQLKRGHDLFLRDRLPPRVFVCNGQYAFQSRRQRVVSLENNPVCTAVTRPAHSVSASIRAAAARTASFLPSADAIQAATCGAGDRRCNLVKSAARSSVPCPRKYGRCRIPQVAAVKSVDCPLKYPRCRKRTGGNHTAIATPKSRRKSR